MTLPHLPMTVISGYLGAGKTTLINRLLAEDHGLRLLVMVNDFGAINVDADLLASADGDTLALTNGCVCCTMGADLFMAIGDALDRRPRPDHLIVEASGIAEPRRIANAAVAEPDMRYGGIVTVVDGVTFPELAKDELIGAQLREQVAQADLLVVNRVATLPDNLLACLGSISRVPAVAESTVAGFSRLLFDLPANPGGRIGAGTHPDYQSFSWRSGRRMSREEIEECLSARPAGLFRLKGRIAATDGGSWEIQVVGSEVSVNRGPEIDETRIVGIGLGARTNRAEVEGWWRGSC